MGDVAKLKPSTDDQTPREPVTGLALLREPFPENLVSKLPKPTKAQTEEVKSNYKAGIRCKQCSAWHHPDVVHLDYVGHAALTHRLLDVDPEWSWEPAAFRDGLPAFDQTGGLWIKLTVCGVTRLGYGHAAGKPNQDPGAREKEVIGDALRNAAMRFGAALDLWHKGDLHASNDDSGEPTPSAEERAMSHLQACGVTLQTLTDAWKANSGGWKGVMDAAAFKRITAEKDRLKAMLSEPAKASEPAPREPSDQADDHRRDDGRESDPFDDRIPF